MKINFDYDKVLKQCPDSMLLDSGIIIASFDCEANGHKVNIDLMVCGEVDVTYKGKDWR